MSDEYTELTLSSGAIVRCAPVPPTVIPQVIADHPDCQMPEPPVEEIIGKTGVQKVIARPGSAEYAEWQTQVQRIRLARERVGRAAQFVVSVIAWKLPGTKNFSSRVAKNWQFPERLLRVGLQPAEDDMGRTADFIQYELLQTAGDLTAISEVAFGPVEELTEDEVEATEEFFRSEEEGTAPSEGAT